MNCIPQRLSPRERTPLPIEYENRCVLESVWRNPIAPAAIRPRTFQPIAQSLYRLGHSGSRNTKVFGETPCRNATLSLTNCTWTGLGFYTGLRSERPAAKHLSQGTALFFTWILARSSYLCCYCDLAVGVAAVFFRSPVCLTELPVFCVRKFMLTVRANINFDRMFMCYDTR